MAKKKELLGFPVEFGQVSIGDRTASVSISADRSSLEMEEADEHLCERRLTGTILAKPAGWREDQQSLPGMNGDHSLAATFDIHSIKVSKEKISCSLSFAISEIEVGDLAKFAKRAGRVEIQESAPIGGDEDKGTDEAE